MKIFDCIKKNNAPHLVQVAFCLLVRLWQKKKMETNAMNMWSEIMICIKLQLVRKAFYEDAVWIKFKCNDSS